MVQAIRHIEQALGDTQKTTTDSERSNIAAARKSIVARRTIAKGESFTQDNITVKRPGTGISPMKWFDVLGRTASRDFQEDELITLGEDGRERIKSVWLPLPELITDCFVR